MKIIVTASELNNKCDWSTVCDITGWGYYVMNEGMSGDTEVVLTEEQAFRLGLIPKSNGDFEQ